MTATTTSRNLGGDPRAYEKITEAAIDSAGVWQAERAMCWIIRKADKAGSGLSLESVGEVMRDNIARKRQANQFLDEIREALWEARREANPEKVGKMRESLKPREEGKAQ